VLTGSALGFRVHSGWAAAVAMGGSVEAPTIIQRWRLELVDRAIPGAVQPYHAAAEMPLHEAEDFLRSCAETTRSLAHTAVQHVVGALSETRYQLSGACILMGSGRPSPQLAATLASHALIHTAEGEFFRDAVKRACESCGLAVSCIKERELLHEASTALGIPVRELTHRISSLGRSLGPPWRQDQKLSALAGWLVLSYDPRHFLAASN